MTTSRQGGSRRAAVIALVVALLIGASAIHLLSGTAELEPPPATHVVAPETHDTAAKRSQSRRAQEARPDDAPSPATPETRSDAPATAVDARGEPMRGGVPRGESADPASLYFIIVTAADDEAQAQGAVRPDDRGRFALPPDLRGRRVRLFAAKGDPRVLLEHPAIVEWSDIAGRNVEFVAPRVTGRVAIRCEDDAGNAVRGKVRIERRLGSDWFTLRTLETATDGETVADAAGPGEYRARLMEAASRSKAFVKPLDRSFRIDGDAPASVRFVLSRPAEIIARVVDEQGRPFAGALVTISTFDTGRFRAHPQGRTVDSDGAVRLIGIEPGRVILHATALGRVPVVRDLDAQPGPNDVVFGLVPGGSRLAGRFTGVPPDARGNSSFHLLGVSDVTRENVVLLVPKPKPDWSFDFDGVAPGRYQLTLMSPEFERIMFWCTVPQHGSAEIGDVDLTAVLRKGELTFDVRVESSEGPGEYAPVVLYRHHEWPDSVWRHASMWTATTHGVKDLVAGTYTLRLSPQGHDPDAWDLSDTTTVTVVEGGKPPTAVLRIRRK